METKVVWSGYNFKGNPNVVAEEIKSIGEEVQPCEIVEYAKSHEDSELYKCFTWDNDIASEKWRLHEARNIVSSLKIVVVEPAKKEPTQFRFFIKTDNDSGYKQTLLVVSDIEERQKMLERAKAELQAFKNKYKTLSELHEIFELIDII